LIARQSRGIIPSVRIVGFLVLWLIARVLCAGEVIKWDPRSMTLVQEGANYGRAVEVSPGRLICAYSRGGKLEIRRSRNGGRTWEAPIPVAEWEHGHLTNAELLPLKDGTLLFLFNRRPDSGIWRTKGREDSSEGGRRTASVSIGVTRSTNGGRTWSEPETLYEAGGEFFNGCWEPAGIQLPSGEIQVFSRTKGRIARATSRRSAWCDRWMAAKRGVRRKQSHSARGIVTVCPCRRC
jgi:BNR/Asp-box repeat.